MRQDIAPGCSAFALQDRCTAFKYILWPSVVNWIRFDKRLSTSRRNSVAHPASLRPTIHEITSGDVADNGILVFSTGRTDANQEAKDSALRHTCHANRGSNGATFHQC